MIWLIIFLLFFILLAVLGGGAFIYLIVWFALMGFAWFVLVLISQDIEGVTKGILWIAGGMFVVGLISAIFSNPDKKTCPHCDEEIKYKANICKHCGRDQSTQKPRFQFQFGREAIARQFRMPDWSNMTFTDYAGAVAMIAGIAIVGFFTLYVLIPH